MARKRTDDLVEVTIAMKPNVEKELLAYGKSIKKTPGDAIESLLKLYAEKAENGDVKKDVVEVGGEKEVTNGDVGEKKGRGRKGIKEKEDAAVGLAKDAKNGGGEQGDDGEHVEQLVKRSPVKKAGPQKGKKAAALEDDNGDATFDVDKAVEFIAEMQSRDKKPKKGKQTPAKDKEENGTEGGEGDLAAAVTGKSKSGQKDDGDAPDAKKRKGKAAAASADDVVQADPVAPASRRGVKKMTSASSIGDTMQPAEEKVDDQVETKGRGKKKPVKAQDAGGATSQPEPSATAVKPKRARAAKAQKNYVEDDGEDDM
jgi:hypothetical protein